MDSCPVSVIIPTYNRAELVMRAIESVLRQTCQCAELIIVDDGSTDGTMPKLDSLARQARVPVRVISIEHSGPAASRNCGVKSARQKFIAFLDSDDHWHKRKLEIQYRALMNNPQYLISHTFEKWLRRGEHLNQKKKHIPRHGHIFDHCLKLCAVGMSTVLMHHELFAQVGFFDEALSCCEDYDFWLRVSCKYPFLLVDMPLTVKEGGRVDQVSYQHRLGMDRLRIYSLEKLMKSDMLSAKQNLLTFRELQRKARIYGKGCMKHNKHAVGRYYFDLIAKYKAEIVKNYPQFKEIGDE
ncbi:MAG: glycosyltransferase family 2 protein [Desulforhopalus sp.]